jgi:hypothetical protein
MIFQGFRYPVIRRVSRLDDGREPRDVAMVVALINNARMVDSSPPEAFIVFIVARSLAAAGKINALVRHQLSEADRTKHPFERTSR